MLKAQERKEAILAYYFLLTAKEDLSAAELDGRIKTWF
jgi:hypothetical protein